MKAAHIGVLLCAGVGGLVAGSALRIAYERANAASAPAAEHPPRLHILRIGVEIPAWTPAELAAEMRIAAEETGACDVTLTRAECNALFVRSFFDCFAGPGETVPCNCQCDHDQDADGDVDLADFAVEQAKAASWIEGHVLDWEGR